MSIKTGQLCVLLLKTHIGEKGGEAPQTLTRSYYFEPPLSKKRSRATAKVVDACLSCLENLLQSKLKEIHWTKEILLDNEHLEEFVLKQKSKRTMQFSQPQAVWPSQVSSLPLGHLFQQAGRDTRKERSNCSHCICI